MDPRPCVVVKLGGSLAAHPSLAHWLRELKHSAAGRYAVVPGGGPFADTVRAAQAVWRFSDPVAHWMAIGAMDQFGQMLCGIEAGLVACSTVLQIQDAWASERLPVWLPTHLMRGRSDLAHGWEVSSDTIAAWLAHTLGARGLLLVKSCDLPADARDGAARILTGQTASHRCGTARSVVRSVASR
jgi:aspartokinase-like uncharacterized kinase